MAKNIELLLTENVDGTGIVGDVVKVRKGFARNYLLPRGYATTPSDELIKQLATKRADAQKMLAELRSKREQIISKLQGFRLTLVRSCNDMGILYAAVTQGDVAAALGTAGFPGIKDREIRLAQTIKRVDNYDIHVKLDSDLDAAIKLEVQSDRPLDLKKSNEASPEPVAPEGAEGAIPSEKRQKDRSAKGRIEEAAAASSEESKPGKFAPRKDKPAADAAPKAEKADADEKPAKAAKGEKAEKGEKKSKK